MKMKYYIPIVTLVSFLFMMFLIAKTLQKAPLVGIDSTYATRSNATIHVHKTKCTYNKDVTIYMDAFNEVSKIYFGKSYQGFITKSRHCKPLPGGTRCLFNHDNKSSDAILYYGGYTILKFQRVFSDQIIVVFTKESEKGHNCHFPPSSQYDLKISYRRDSTVPVPFICNSNLALRVAKMGPPDVPISREKMVASFISGCKHQWRNDYLTKLMEYIHVDQWGACLKNTPGDFWKTRHANFEKEKLNFLEKHPYKFLVAFKNAVEEDYVTEKVYHAYLTRSIPIYYGDKAVFDLVPANSSLIYANNYSPKELAELIQRIANNDTLYSQYFSNWDLFKMHKLHEKYCLEHFTCSTCRKVWNILYDRKCSME